MIVYHYQTGGWKGEEIKCEVEYLKHRTVLFLQIVIPTMLVSIIILIVDFILRRYRKGKLRTEKSRIARIMRIRNINQIESIRIRPFAKMKEDIVGKAIRNITREADADGGVEDTDLRYRNKRFVVPPKPVHKEGEAEGAVRTPANIFQAFRPKIKI